jgi:hypothetical protein
VLKSPAVLAGLFSWRMAENYRATRNFDSELPMLLKAAMIWVAVVTVENLSARWRSIAERPRSAARTVLNDLRSGFVKPHGID